MDEKMVGELSLQKQQILTEIDLILQAQAREDDDPNSGYAKEMRKLRSYAKMS